MDKKKKLVGNSAQKSGVHSFPCSLCFVVDLFTLLRLFVHEHKTANRSNSLLHRMSSSATVRVGKLQLVDGAPAAVGCGRRNSGLL